MTSSPGFPSAILSAAREALSGRSAAVVGAGRTGASTARFLVATGARVSVTDSRMAPPGLEELPRAADLSGLALGGIDPELLARADLVVVSPGVPLEEPAIRQAVDRGAEVIGDVELLGRFAPGPVVAITGSNGKSTVTSLVGAMLKEAGVRPAVGGNLGTPAPDLLAEAPVDCFVVEVSSFQAEALDTFHPRVAALLNLSPDHLDRYPDEEAYFGAKWRLFRNMGSGDTAVLGRDDPRIRERSGVLRDDVGIAWFGHGEPVPGGTGVVVRDGEEWLALGGAGSPEPVLRISDWPLVGRSNRANAAAALAVGSALGLPVPAMAAALRGFSGLPHRMEAVAEIGGVRYVNDSKGTNVGAVQAALEGLAEPFVWIAGGADKGGDFAALAPVLRDRCRLAVLMGPAADTIAAALEGVVPAVRAGGMGEAVARATESAQPGDSVVLSPGCTSFDRYTDFKARGDDFRQAVRAREAENAEP